MNVVVVVVVTYKDLVEGVGKNTREVNMVVVESEHSILEEVVVVVVVVVKVKAEVAIAVAVEESKLVAEVAVILMEGVVKNTWEVKVVVVVVVVVVVKSEHGILEEVVVKVAVVKVVALKEEVEVSTLVVEVAVMVMLEAKKEQRDDI